MVKRLYPTQPIVGIGIIILWRGKILLVKRRNEPEKGKWTIPGGVVELGESLTQAVIREAKEETSLDVSNPILFDAVDIVKSDTQGKIMYHFVIVDYLATVSNYNKATPGSDAAELRWIPINGVESYDLTSSFRLFFLNNQQRLEQASSAQ